MTPRPREPLWIDSDGCAYFGASLPPPSTERDPTKDETLGFYSQALSKSWLPRNIRSAILRELGWPPRRYNAANQRLRAWGSGNWLRASKLNF